MKKITGLSLLLILTLSLSANEITFLENLTWQEVKNKAARENKMIFFDGYTTWCGPCKYLDKDVYTDESVAAYFNENFINVKFDMEKGEGIKLAEEFSIYSYPTLLFFSPDGKPVHKYIGAMEPAEFLELGKDARDPSKQYFVLKEKAGKLSLTDKEFYTWATQADYLEDEDKDDIIAQWLDTKTDLLANADIVNTILKYVTRMSVSQYRFLLKNQPVISKLLGWDESVTASALYRKIFLMAANAYDESGAVTDSFSAVIRKYNPEKVNYAVKDLDFRLALMIDKDSKKATDLFLQYLADTKEPISIKDLSDFILNFSEGLSKEDFSRIKTALSSFKIRSIDKDQECWLYMMQMIASLETGDEDKAKEFAEKAFRHNFLPASYKEMLKENFGVTTDQTKE